MRKDQSRKGRKGPAKARRRADPPVRTQGGRRLTTGTQPRTPADPAGQLGTFGLSPDRTSRLNIFVFGIK